MLPGNLLQSLYQAENDIHTFYPIARRHAELRNRLAALEQGHKDHSNNGFVRVFIRDTFLYILLAVSVSFPIVFFCFPTRFFLPFIAIAALVVCVLRIPFFLKEKKKQGELEKTITQTKSDIAKSTQLISRKVREMAGMQIWKTMMPKECLIPEYARQFINYIETNQVSSLQDANMMFDRFLHREQMTEDWAENAAIISAVSRVVNSADTAVRAPRRPAQNAVAPSAGCFCPRCGVKNVESRGFCASCGSRLN